MNLANGHLGLSAILKFPLFGERKGTRDTLRSRLSPDA
jgi:hypothetical protein